MAKKISCCVVYLFASVRCLEMSAVVRHSSWLLFAEVASPFLSSFFFHDRNTQEPHAVLTLLCMDWGVFHGICEGKDPVTFTSLQILPSCSWMPIRSQPNQQFCNFNYLKKRNTGISQCCGSGFCRIGIFFLPDTDPDRYPGPADSGAGSISESVSAKCYYFFPENFNTLSLPWYGRSRR